MPPNNTQRIKWKYINLNPSPTVRDLIKIHKADSPVRPIVNWTNDPEYKLAKMLSKNLEILIRSLSLSLSLTHTHTNTHVYVYNVKNTIYLMKYLLEITFHKDLKCVSFDMTNMYSNVPMKELIKIIELMCCQNDLNKELSSETKVCKILTKQLYLV